MPAPPERLRWWLLPLLLLAACSHADLAPPRKIALLASFEGRERAIGYELLTAAQLALADAARPDLTLLPVDIGDTVADALSRILALRGDSLVHVVILAGALATAAEPLAALADLPALVIADGRIGPAAANVWRIRPDSRPTATLAERYRARNPYAPPPGPLTTAGYEAATIAASLAGAEDRAAVARALRNIARNGIASP